MPAFGDILDPLQMRKSLFKLNLKLSDLSLNLPPEVLPLIICNYRFIQSPHSQSPYILLKALIVRQVYFVNACVYVIFICSCHKRICPWGRDHGSLMYTIVFPLLRVLLKESTYCLLNGQRNHCNKIDMTLCVYLM